MQDITVGGRLANAQYQFTLQDADANELNDWAPRILARLSELPQLRDVATDQQTGGTTMTVEIDRDAAANYGITPKMINDTLYDAFGQSQATQYFTQITTTTWCWRSLPEVQAGPRPCRQIFIRSPLTEAQVPSSSFTWSSAADRPIVVNHQSMFPSVTISFNLAPGVALGEAVAAIQQAMQEMGTPGSVISSFQGNAQAFQESLAVRSLAHRGGAGRGLHRARHPLRELRPPADHPLHLAVGRPGRAADAWGSSATTSHRGADRVILLIGIVKKNGIMLVDFAHHGGTERGQDLEGGDPRGLPAALPPILMTTMAALLAGVPLMLGTGTGTEIRQPLGYAMVGGLSVSQALTLFTTPVVYLYLDRLRRARADAGTARPSARDASEFATPVLMVRRGPARLCQVRLRRTRGRQPQAWRAWQPGLHSRRRGAPRR